MQRTNRRIVTGTLRTRDQLPIALADEMQSVGCEGCGARILVRRQVLKRATTAGCVALCKPCTMEALPQVERSAAAYRIEAAEKATRSQQQW